MKEKNDSVCKTKSSHQHNRRYQCSKDSSSYEDREFRQFVPYEDEYALLLTCPCQAMRSKFSCSPLARTARSLSVAVIDAGQLSLAVQSLGGAERAGLVNAGQVVLERSAGDGVGQHCALGAGEGALVHAAVTPGQVS